MEDYSNIIEFIKDFTYPDHDMIENCPYDGYSSGIYAFEKREVVRGEDTISFENEGDFIKKEHLIWYVECSLFLRFPPNYTLVRWICFILKL